jgi:phosphoglycolate phosphatase-like HAD superfamily hydrolase
MPLTSGVAEMLTSLKNIGAVFIVVSDANEVFIREPLVHADLFQLFDKIFTNPAEFDETGKLNMVPFTEQVTLLNLWPIL